MPSGGDQRIGGQSMIGFPDSCLLHVARCGWPVKIRVLMARISERICRRYVHAFFLLVLRELRVKWQIRPDVEGYSTNLFKSWGQYLNLMHLMLDILLQPVVHENRGVTHLDWTFFGASVQTSFLSCHDRFSMLGAGLNQLHWYIAYILSWNFVSIAESMDCTWNCEAGARWIE